ncbi:MAG: hypothetical protein CM1200mP34_0730 [Verrucomicrobiales bacterium]|nr:MAG: hypothetical protein CM1200mP34_0730 [Verrucomicrobiales bacterium]
MARRCLSSASALARVAHESAVRFRCAACTAARSYQPSGLSGILRVSATSADSSCSCLPRWLKNWAAISRLVVLIDGCSTAFAITSVPFCAWPSCTCVVARSSASSKLAGSAANRASSCRSASRAILSCCSALVPWPRF